MHSTGCDGGARQLENAAADRPRTVRRQTFPMPSRMGPRRTAVRCSIGRRTKRSIESHAIPIANMPTTIRAGWKYCCALKMAQPVPSVLAIISPLTRERKAKAMPSEFSASNWTARPGRLDRTGCGSRPSLGSAVGRLRRALPLRPEAHIRAASAAGDRASGRSSGRTWISAPATAGS